MITTNLKSKKDLTLNEINFLLNEEDDLKTYKKLQYFKFKIMGFSKIESCELSGINEDSRYYLENLWDKGGYNALIPHYGGGRKSKLKENELKELTEILQKDDSWLIKDVEKLIKSKYDVEYGYHGVRNLLIKLNIPIANHFEVERENKNNVVNNINNLSDDAISEINKISMKIKDEKSTFVLKKLSYLLLRYLGFSNKQSSEFYSITSATGNNWLTKWKTEGYEGLKRKKGQGRKRKINDENMSVLKKTK